MAEVALTSFILFIIIIFFIFILFSNVGELNPGLCTCWADIFPLSYFFSPKYFLSLAVLDLNSGLYACKVALCCLSYIISPF
jgi:hypothetical protein